MFVCENYAFLLAISMCIAQFAVHLVQRRHHRYTATIGLLVWTVITGTADQKYEHRD